MSKIIATAVIGFGIVAGSITAASAATYYAGQPDWAQEVFTAPKDR